jgi:esterase/lipase superfamily enzyme
VNVEHHEWHSPALGRTMRLLVIGHAGARTIVFPTSGGGYLEWAERHMHDALAEHLERGWIQMFCVDHVPFESWYADDLHPGARAWRQLQYDQYLSSEFMPFTASRNGNPFVITVGASFGAYQAAAFGLRHPDLVHRIIGLSGLYDIRRFTSGYSDHNVYAVNPVEFMPNEHEPWRLDAFRRQDIILAVGRDDPLCEANRQFSTLLWDKGIGNALRIWDGWYHDWPYWQQMIRLYIGGHD